MEKNDDDGDVESIIITECDQKRETRKDDKRRGEGRKEFSLVHAMKTERNTMAI